MQFILFGVFKETWEFTDTFFLTMCKKDSVRVNWGQKDHNNKNRWKSDSFNMTKPRI